MGLVDQLVADTRALVMIDSRNPEVGEQRVADWLMQRLKVFQPTQYSVTPNRSNAVATLPGRSQEGRLHLLCHMDTVPLGPGWSVDPFAGLTRDGAIWGLGAADMKAGTAVAANVLLDLQAEGFVPSSDILLWLTVDEETSEMCGVRDLVNRGFFKPGDAAVALEPTGLRLRLAQVGVRWARLSIRGRTAHAGRGHLGADANIALAEAMLNLRAEVQALEHVDPLLGRALMTPGLVRGGSATNMVSGLAEADIDIRLVPPMTDDDALKLVEGAARYACAQVEGTDWTVRPLGPPRPPNRAAEDGRIVPALRSAYLAETGTVLVSGGSDGHEAYTDASMLGALTGSRDCTVFGPGSSDFAHVPDEHVPIADLEIAYRVIRRLCREWGREAR